MRPSGIDVLKVSLSVLNPEDRGSNFPRHVGIHLSGYSMSLFQKTVFLIRRCKSQISKELLQDSNAPIKNSDRRRGISNIQPQQNK